MLELRFLGGAVIRRDDRPLPPAATHRHSVALLALLAAAPDHTLSRGKLVGLLWPGAGETTARNRLNTAVHRLRKALGDDRLASVGGGLRLNQELVRCDMWRFRAHLEAGRPAAAVDIYEGAFLDGFWLKGSREFEDWLELERDRLRRAYRQALEALAEAAERSGTAAAAVEWWRERSVQDPYDSRVAHRLVRALVAAGNRTGALRAARAHASLLATKLGTEPDADIQRMMDTLLETGPGVGPTYVPSVAVLPFEQLGRHRTGGAFAEGLHNDLLTRLSRIKGLKVISRTSVLRYRDGGKAVPVMAAELGVDAIVEGSVQYVGDRIRLNVQLIEGRGDVHRWAETYDRELTTTNLFDIQSELAEKITGSLHQALTPRERERIMNWAPTQDLEAYRLHAHGRARLDERTEEGMRRALGYFEDAVVQDPRYALAWTGSADALTLLHEYGYEARDRVLPRADAAIRRALTLDPGLAEAHASLGLLHEARQEGPPAIRALERAVELQPGYAEAHNWLSWTNQLLGRPAEALASAQNAVELNPLSPEVVSNLAVSYLINGRAPAARTEARRASELQPGWSTPRFYEVLALFDLERFQEAGELLDGLSVPWAGSGADATAALNHAATGDVDRARRLQSEFEEAGDHCAVGLLHAALGDLDRAFAALSRIERWSYWPTLAVHHYYSGILRPLRRDHRYGPILEQVNTAWGLARDGSLPPL